MDVIAGRDGALGASYHLAIAAHDLSGRDRLNRDLVSGGHVIEHGERCTFDTQFHAGRQGHARYGDVVGGVQVDGGVFRGGEFRDI